LVAPLTLIVRSLGIFVFACLMAAAPVASAAVAIKPPTTISTQGVGSYTVNFDETARFIWGNLTWMGGKGHIVWGPAAEGTGGGGTPADANTVTANEAEWSNGDPAETYTGAPLTPYRSRTSS